MAEVVCRSSHRHPRFETVPGYGRSVGKRPRPGTAREGAKGSAAADCRNMTMAEESRYEILQEVGRGGMGIVYKAMDRETSELVALKVLRPEVLDDKLMMERFKNELRTARKITHKNVCRIYELTHIEEGPCISMEYVEGET